MIEKIFDNQDTDDVDLKVEKIKYIVMAKEILEYFFNKRFTGFFWEERKDPINLDQFQYDYTKISSTYRKVTHSGNIIHGTSKYKEIAVNFGNNIGHTQIGTIPFFIIRENFSEEKDTLVQVYINQKINHMLGLPLSSAAKEEIVKIFNNNGYPITDINFASL